MSKTYPCVRCGATFARTKGPQQHCSIDCRLWASVDQSGGPNTCWPWMGTRDRKFGHGRIRVGARKIIASRVAWELTRGPIPDGLDVLHSCDHGPCCNPAHLFLGTQADNNADMVRKGRHSHGATHAAASDPHFGEWARGESNPNARMTQDRVRAMRQARARGATLPDLVRAFGVSKSTAHAIVTGATWRHVA